MAIVVMELHSSWKWVVLIKLQLKLHCIDGELQMVIATQKLSCKVSCKTPFFLIVQKEMF
jgi:hypothetical protein